ncbi:hypothetical protein K0M31_007514 [Melipona bicolor]|uniref:Uncharacterized protein n=1 Tax=Melipona bicolor TaxID=60889 RepID=A0AA40GCE6_9HYME|nr:hypothetical protein K0M31_007514 [Melipona bicolor]
MQLASKRRGEKGFQDDQRTFVTSLSTFQGLMRPWTTEAAAEAFTTSTTVAVRVTSSRRISHRNIVLSSGSCLLSCFCFAGKGRSPQRDVLRAGGKDLGRDGQRGNTLEGQRRGRSRPFRDVPPGKGKSAFAVPDANYKLLRFQRDRPSDVIILPGSSDVERSSPSGEFRSTATRNPSRSRVL